MSIAIIHISFNCLQLYYILVFFFYSYKHAIDGLARVCREEGFIKLFNGCSTATMRAAFMTIGQLSFYDQIKMFLLTTEVFQDNPTTHFLSSLSAVSLTFSDNNYIASNVHCHHLLIKCLCVII